MGTKPILITCMAILTAIVVFSVGRIEYLNAAGGHILPRTEIAGQQSIWDISDLDTVLKHMDRQFFERRQIAAKTDAQNTDNAEPAEVAMGAPYSKSEQRSIDNVTFQHDAITKLHWWIKTLGWAQYFLAPAALLACIACGLALKGWQTKAAAIACASACCSCIFLILVRGY